MTENQKQLLTSRGYSKVKIGWDYRTQKQTRTTVELDAKGMLIYWSHGGKLTQSDPVCLTKESAESKIREVFKTTHPQDLQEIFQL